MTPVATASSGARCRYIGTELDGFDWEIVVDLETLVVNLYRLRFRHAPGCREVLELVAVGRFDGERIGVTRWFSTRGDPLEPHRDLPILAEMLRTELQS